jgi:integrase
VRRQLDRTGQRCTIDPRRIRLDTDRLRQLLQPLIHNRHGVGIVGPWRLREGELSRLDQPDEALGLRGTDVDLGAGLLVVQRALQRHTWQHGCGGACGRKRGADCRGLLVVETKSRSGRRAIGLPPPLVELLREHRAVQDAGRAFAGSVWQEGGWLFAQPNGKPTDPRPDHAEWKELLRAARVREARLHDARHTATTMLLVLGVPQRVVMDVMGWSHRHDAAVSARVRAGPARHRRAVRRPALGTK